MVSFCLYDCLSPLCWSHQTYNCSSFQRFCRTILIFKSTVLIFESTILIFESTILIFKSTVLIFESTVLIFRSTVLIFESTVLIFKSTVLIFKSRLSSTFRYACGFAILFAELSTLGSQTKQRIRGLSGRVIVFGYFQC